MIITNLKKAKSELSQNQLEEVQQKHDAKEIELSINFARVMYHSLLEKH